MENEEFFKNYEKILLHKYYFFHKIVEYKDLARAARYFKVPPYKIKNDLISLEKSLGSELYIRNRPDFKLTPEGEKFAHFCENISGEFEVLRKRDLPKEEELIIATYYGYAEKMLPKTLTKFTKKYPHVRLKILTGIEYVDFTLPEIDILIAAPLNNRSDLQSIHLTTDSHYLFASPDYIKKYGSPQSFEDLENHKFLLFKGVDYTPKEFFGELNNFIESTSLGFLYKMVKLGYGIAPLPIFRLQDSDLYDTKLIEIMKGHECLETPISFMTKRFSSKASLINSFHDFLIDTIHEKEIK